jgi:UDP-GlcNAc:undecaprenyl-phosphate GlcNAc-1-phosphate transferase
MPFLAAFGLALVLTPLLAVLGRRVGLVDHPTGDLLKIHERARPLTGGIGVIAATLIAVVAAGPGPPPLVAAGILTLLAVGVLDDAVGLPPTVRLLAECAAGVLLAVGGVSFEILGQLGPVVLVLSVPVVANAVNMMDGQDGLVAGLAAVAALGLTLVAAGGGEFEALGPACIGSLVAFLVWNRPPASVFLGDGGAYGVAGVLVLLLADAATTWAGVLGGVACLGIFALEFGSTILRRVVSKAPLVSGDRSHLYDLLADRLGGRGRSTVAMIAAGGVAAAVGALSVRLPLIWGVALVAVSVAAGALAIRALWRAQRV